MSPPRRQSSPSWRSVMKPAYDLVCLSHLRWDFVFQRPQQLLSRCAEHRRVFFVEEPFFDTKVPYLEVRQPSPGICVAVPHLPAGRDADAVTEGQERLLTELLAEHDICRSVLWYYTPMAVPFTRHLKPLATVYDCMDELALFKGASAALTANEDELFARADLVFTGGPSLYEA